MSVGAVFAQLPDYLGEKLDVPAVVTRDTDGRHVLLDGRADNVADVTMKPEINHFDTVPDKLQVDRVDGTVVAVADRNSRENANGRRHRN